MLIHTDQAGLGLHSLMLSQDMDHKLAWYINHSLLTTLLLTTLTFGWSGGAMVLGKLPVPGRPTIWITVGQGSSALAVGAGGGCLDIFTLIYPFSPLSPSLWETTRYRLKYCLKGPLNPKQPTNQPTTLTLLTLYLHSTSISLSRTPFSSRL